MLELEAAQRLADEAQARQRAEAVARQEAELRAAEQAKAAQRLRRASLGCWRAVGGCRHWAHRWQAYNYRQAQDALAEVAAARQDAQVQRIRALAAAVPDQIADGQPERAALLAREAFRLDQEANQPMPEVAGAALRAALGAPISVANLAVRRRSCVRRGLQSGWADPGLRQVGMARCDCGT